MKILSISDCYDWFALFRDDNDEPKFVPLACWALVRDAHLKGEDDVIGLIVDPDTYLIERASETDISLDIFTKRTRIAPPKFSRPKR